VLVLVLLMMLVLAGTGTVAVLLAANAVGYDKNREMKVESFYLAEAGLHLAYAKMGYSKTFADAATPASYPEVQGGSYAYIIESAPTVNDYRVYALGRVVRGSRTVQTFVRAYVRMVPDSTGTPTIKDWQEVDRAVILGRANDVANPKKALFQSWL
jgi:hypothetical protein